MFLIEDNQKKKICTMIPINKDITVLSKIIRINQQCKIYESNLTHVHHQYMRNCNQKTWR